MTLSRVKGLETAINPLEKDIFNIIMLCLLCHRGFENVVFATHLRRLSQKFGQYGSCDCGLSPIISPL